MVNSTYGKFAKNPNNFTFTKLCICERDFNKAIKANRFQLASIINQAVAILEYEPERILHDSLYPVPETTLGQPKINLCCYYYDFLTPLFLPDKVYLIMTDTYSLIFSATCKNVFKKYKKYLCLILVISKQTIICILIKTEKSSFCSKLKIPMIL